MNKAPISFKYLEKIVYKLIQEDEYIDKCYDIGYNLFDLLPTYGLIEGIIDRLFTPDTSKKPYDTFSWWCEESNFGEKELLY